MKKLKSREVKLLQSVQLLSGPEDLSLDVILEFTCLTAVPFFLRSECSVGICGKRTRYTGLFLGIFGFSFSLKSLLTLFKFEKQSQTEVTESVNLCQTPLKNIPDFITDFFCLTH